MLEPWLACARYGPSTRRITSQDTCSLTEHHGRKDLALVYCKHSVRLCVLPTKCTGLRLARYFNKGNMHYLHALKDALKNH